jgi:hypothetical protein
MVQVPNEAKGGFRLENADGMTEICISQKLCSNGERNRREAVLKRTFYLKTQ